MLLVASVKKRILVIEEPEEGMPPIQQAVFINVLEGLLKSFKDQLKSEEVYVILATHPLCIAYTLREARLYYVR